MVKGIQVLGMLVGIYLMAQTVNQYRKGNYSVTRTAFWVGLWALITILFAFPSLTMLALPILATENMMFTVLVAGLIIVYALMYQTYQQAARTERKLTELLQNVAIHNYVKESTGNPKEKDDEQ